MREAHRCIRCGTVQGIGTFGGRKINRTSQILHQRWSNCEGKWPICSSNWGKVGMHHHARSVRPWLPRNGQFDCRRISCPCAIQRSPNGSKTVKPISKTPAAWGMRAKSRGCARDSRDSIRHGPIFRVAFHGDEFHQDGAVSIVTHQCGMWGIRVGEVINPGPSRRRDVAWRANMAQCWTVIQMDHWQESGYVWGRDTRIVRSQEFFPRRLFWILIQMRG